jgi:hypothetical protein
LRETLLVVLRAEQEKKLAQQKKEEEEKIRKEEAEKKAKEAEEKKKRLEEAEAKRQQMLEAQKGGTKCCKIIFSNDDIPLDLFFYFSMIPMFLKSFVSFLVFSFLPTKYCTQIIFSKNVE